MISLTIALILKKQLVVVRQNAHVEIIFMILCPWICYLIAEMLELSGIVAILSAGAFLSEYASPNLHGISKRVLSKVTESGAYICETMVFLFLGLGLFTFEDSFSKTGVGLFVWTPIIILFARLLNVFICSFLTNIVRRKMGFSTIPWKT